MIDLQTSGMSFADARFFDEAHYPDQVAASRNVGCFLMLYFEWSLSLIFSVCKEISYKHQDILY